MKTISVRQPINLKVVRFELDFTQLAPQKPKPEKIVKRIRIPKVNHGRKKRTIPPPPLIRNISNQNQDVKDLVDELLDELYADHGDWTSAREYGSISAASLTSTQSNCGEQTDAIERSYLEALDVSELQEQCSEWKARLQEAGERLARHVRVRDRLKRQQKRLSAAFTVLIRHITGDKSARFGVTPGEGLGEGGFSEWLHAMRLVARLPAGVPEHFRRKLWLTLSDRHLTSRGIDWPAAERACFRGTAHPDDTELGAQILKDLHRTGCSLFCGTEGRENQAMLRRVLLAYARWNKEVGYCQGFNMLAAIILEVMEKSESDSLKVMIYLVEAVLPEGYFADDLRGLSADMAAFRDLLRIRLPRLAQHMDHLQRISDGGGVEPPLPDVFTMQWFLTLYATWLPRESLLRIWDLILLDGNEILLLTALAIWDMLQDRIMSTRSADEYYSCMGGGAGVVWAAGEALVARVVALGPADELPRLRSLHRYRVTPPVPNAAPQHSVMQSMTKRGLRLFYSEDEGDSSDDGNKMALATVIPRRQDRMDTGDRLSLDIGALKRQYARLRERQRQAHVILAAACARHAAVGVPTSPTSLTVNNLLLGKSAIVSSRGRRLGPPPGAIPPSRQTSSPREKTEESSLDDRSNETISWNEEKTKKCISRRNSLQWRDIKKDKSLEKRRKASIDFDEHGDGVIVSEIEANKMLASLRSRSSSDSSSYSSHSKTSSDTSLCDDNEGESDSEHDLLEDTEKKRIVNTKDTKHSPISKKSEKRSPIKELKVTPCSDKTNSLNITEKTVPDISEYLGSVAGEPLRTYIDGFERKVRDTLVLNEANGTNAIISYSNITQPNPKIESERSPMRHYENISHCEASYKNIESPRSKKPVYAKIFTDLSPIDLSPCQFGTILNSPLGCNFESNLSNPSSFKISSRPPDIIDSLSKYPNFVPDIDLSDKNISDFESPSRSPGSESIAVSEDEPPIPLKIDKYFEHSPEFFGARVTYPNDSDIPNRRATKRLSRIPRKPDSLTIHTTENEKNLTDDIGRASSLPHSHSFTEDKYYGSAVTENKCSTQKDCSDVRRETDNLTILSTSTPNTANLPDEELQKDLFLQLGRKNSERALQIIQENSQILSRILTKQNISQARVTSHKLFSSITDQNDDRLWKQKTNIVPDKKTQSKSDETSSLKESTSDSLIGYRKKFNYGEVNEKNDFMRIRPISLDDPVSLEARDNLVADKEFLMKTSKSPSIECLANRTDLYGWENRGFFAKTDYKNSLVTRIDTGSCSEAIEDGFNCKNRVDDFSSRFSNFSRQLNSTNMEKTSCNSKKSNLSTTPQPVGASTHDTPLTGNNYEYSFSNKYDIFLTNANLSDQNLEQGPKTQENLTKTDNSQISEFTQVVTSSVSFSYEPSVEDDSPMGAKSNSSDTLCQITSLDQVSTPISPKNFPNRETPTLPKDIPETSNTPKIESDDTCSTITSLIDTDTLSSLSYPRSPSTGSYHPFPTRSALRLPKDLPVRLGMYPKETIGPSKIESNNKHYEQ